MRTYIKIAGMSIVSAIVLTLFTNSGCDKGVDSKKDDSIVGAWRMVTVLIKDTPVGNLNMQAENFLELSGTGAKTSTLRFNEDGSALLTTIYKDDSEEDVPGTWSVEGNQLTLNGAGIDDTVTYDVKGNTLTLTMIMPIDFDFDGTADDTEIDMIYDRL